MSRRNPLAGHTLGEFASLYLLSGEAVCLYLFWFFMHVAFYFILPGRVVQGVVLDSTGARLSYPLNGKLSLFASSAVMVSLAYAGVIEPTVGYDLFPQLAFTATMFSYALSIYLYASSLYSSRDNGRYLTSENALAAHGTSGNALYDFFIGRTLNPRLGALDLKYFCELRPGLILWFLLNLSMVAKQVEKHADVSASIILVNLFQAYYVYDALNSEVNAHEQPMPHEPTRRTRGASHAHPRSCPSLCVSCAQSAILTTMDITTDGFGWMLAFGDLAWVPFVYSTQARFLVDHPAALHPLSVMGILAVKALGFWIFRGSNGEKNEFRTNPTGAASAHLRYLQTASGSKLLISGWWGMARHMNYLGDLLMGLAWCLPCGLQSAIPYFYFVYFATLLVHRERRDEEKCRNKYGKDWDRYCSIVPYRIVPFVY